MPGSAPASRSAARHSAATVSAYSRSRGSCGTRPTRRTRSRAGVRCGTAPAARTEPADGSTRPTSADSRVDFLAPLRPMRATVSPGETVRSTPCRASVRPRRTASPRTSATGPQRGRGSGPRRGGLRRSHRRGAGAGRTAGASTPSGTPAEAPFGAAPEVAPRVPSGVLSGPPSGAVRRASRSRSGAARRRASRTVSGSGDQPARRPRSTTGTGLPASGGTGKRGGAGAGIAPASPRTGVMATWLLYPAGGKRPGRSERAVRGQGAPCAVRILAIFPLLGVPLGKGRFILISGLRGE
ncbi:hypothetical protein SUDANB6_04209 [Streptomyces sp. enrichment culture]